MKRLLQTSLPLFVLFVVLVSVLAEDLLAQNSVTFLVRMRVKRLEGVFKPDSGDVVTIPGAFNGWNTSADTLRDLDGDSIYTITKSIAAGSYEYKFWRSPRGGGDGWESSPNRSYTVTTSDTVRLTGARTDYFDQDSLVSVATSGNIVWSVDMSALHEMGWFVRGSNDSVEIRGSFNGWGTSPRRLLTRVSGTERYEATIAYSGFTYDDFDYKFYLDLDSLGGAGTRFPGWGTGNRDDFNYEHPAERGDGNRKFNLGAGGNLNATGYFFNSVSRSGIIRSSGTATDTVTAKFRVNMKPTIGTADSFKVGASGDTLRVVIIDALSRAVQGNQTITLTEGATADSIYEGTYNIVSKPSPGLRAHYHLLYAYRIVRGPQGGSAVQEGGGLGGQNLFRSRYIQPVTTGVPNIFPRNYTLPQESWQKSAPYTPETAPFSILTDVGSEPALGPPTSFDLYQNYPNPFNPSTRIRYSLTDRAHVVLKVFNLLGQEVATLVNEEQPVGNYVALFEAHKLAAGVYFYTLQAGNFHETRKMVLLK